jgi:hypothetical protein
MGRAASRHALLNYPMPESGMGLGDFLDLSRRQATEGLRFAPETLLKAPAAGKRGNAAEKECGVLQAS